MLVFVPPKSVSSVKKTHYRNTQSKGIVTTHGAITISRVRRRCPHCKQSACRDDHERLLLALARFGGLRIPSEVRLLRFSDFTENAIQIHRDTKTGAREVPLFGEIREIFDRIQAGLGKDFKPSDLVFGNLGSFRMRIFAAIRAAGVEQWSKHSKYFRCITTFQTPGVDYAPVTY